MVQVVLTLGLAAASLLLAIVAIAAQGGRVSLRLDVLTHFAPIYVAVALLFLAVGALFADGLGRLVVVAAAGVALVASLALILPEILAAGRVGDLPADTLGQLRIVQFNAWGQNQRADAAVAWIIAQKPDLIMLEEGRRLRTRLIEEGGYVVICPSCRALILAKAGPLSDNNLGRRATARQSYAIAHLTDASGPYSVVAIHRPWPTRTMALAEQMNLLRRDIAGLDASRLIMAGDFNSTPWSFARRREDRDLGLRRRTLALATWPAGRLSHYRLPAPFPFMPIDHVYAGRGWATVRVERGPRLGSDHYPVFVILAPQ